MPRQVAPSPSSGEHPAFTVADLSRAALLLRDPAIQGLLLRDPAITSAKTAQEQKVVVPPSQGWPSSTFPVGADTAGEQLAPAPLVDRYPGVVGKQLTFAYIAQCARLATTGYRQQAVDLWRELLEEDPHLSSVVVKRILSVANGRLEVLPADLDEDDADYQLAVDAADMVREEFARVEDLTVALASLLWAIYYAVTAAEIMWSRDSDGWHVDRLAFVHTRRLGWPDMQTWDLHVWDQGSVLGWEQPWGSSPTNAGTWGLRVKDWSSKFVVFAPQMFGDYPTRDGIARQVAMWAAFKRTGVRGAIDYLERFAKGYVDVSFTTQATGEPRAATEQDIRAAQQLASVLGFGNGRTATHPDSITVTPKSFDAGGAGSKLTWKEWVDICNAEMSKIVLGGTLGTEAGSKGARSLGEVQERGEVDLEQYDATALAQCLRKYLVGPLVRLNMPRALRCLPRIRINIESEPDAKSVVENAKVLAQLGAQLDADDVCEKAGFKCVPNLEKDEDGKPKPRRLFWSDVIDPSLVDPSLKSQEAKDAEQEDKDNLHEQAMTKAAQPVVAPGGAVPGGRAANGNAAPKRGSPKAAAGKKTATPAPSPKVAPKPAQAGRRAARLAPEDRDAIVDQILLSLEERMSPPRAAE